MPRTEGRGFHLASQPTEVNEGRGQAAAVSSRNIVSRTESAGLSVHSFCSATQGEALTLTGSLPSPAPQYHRPFTVQGNWKGRIYRKEAQIKHQTKTCQRRYVHQELNMS
ncbi:hypothetical protein chiPu_0014349 [Chiloscyllium punctatum]|uniref:Uncharacterized protein n=1 Tax=Chiloscyllium punctatum TaxID=137246 RepID=A0A401SZQ7_CHIPU|nr:hypothetical protein [Chiloscyllium punctatum]